MPKGHRLPDLTNRKFGALTLVEKVVEEAGLPHRPKWRCRCDCGKEVQRRQDYLLQASNPSCGCKNFNRINSGNLSKLWGGHGEISGAYFNMIRKGATNRNIPFDLTIEYIWSLFEAQDRNCALSGLPLQFRRSKRTARDTQTASLDRIDSLHGYVEGNVWWVHKIINHMCSHFDKETFIHACNAVAITHPREIDQSIIDEAKGTRNAYTGRRPVKSN